MKTRFSMMLLLLLVETRSFSLMSSLTKRKIFTSTINDNFPIFSLSSHTKYHVSTFSNSFSKVKANTNIISSKISFKYMYKFITSVILSLSLLSTPSISFADDELAQYAAQGNDVGVDGQCFFKKCSFETSACANDPSCLKGLACLARCKGSSLCSTGCFAKFGSKRLDNLLYCSVEKNDCVHVPGKESLGWTVDSIDDLPFKPSRSFDIASMQGTWYKVMGLDSRYDCFDCQRNKFEIKNKNTLKMETVFRIPRQTFPGYLQNKIIEDLTLTAKDTTSLSPMTTAAASFFPTSASASSTSLKPIQSLSHMQSKGQMFGLTFWENWYVINSDDIAAINSKFAARFTKSRPLEQQTQDYDQAMMSTYSSSSSTAAAAAQGSTSRLPSYILSNPVAIPKVNAIDSSGSSSSSDADRSVTDSLAVIGSTTMLSTTSTGNRPESSTDLKTTATQRVSDSGADTADSPSGDFKLVYYTGHTLQGSYKGAFILARQSQITPDVYKSASRLIRLAGLNPTDFCIIRNQCFLTATAKTDITLPPKDPEGEVPFWFVGQKFFKVTESVAKELADWFQDPVMSTDWLINQQQRMVLQQPLAVSPFASLVEEKIDSDTVWVELLAP